MKQRLLLCLLMLMVSVGILQAKVDITIAAGDPKESVTITFTSSTNKFWDKSKDGIGNYPVITNYDKEGILKVTADKTVYTIPYKETAQEIDLSTKYPIDVANVWGDVTVTIKGKVSTFTSDNGDFTDHVTSLIFEKNGVLTSLKLGEYYVSSPDEYFPKLTYLDCSGNKLTRIPAKGKVLKDYIIGEQSPLKEQMGMSGKANSFEVVVSEGIKNLFSETISPSELSIKTLKDENGKTLSDVTITKADEVKSIWHFTYKEDGAFLKAGSYKADIAVNNPSYPGLVICNVPLNINATTFTLKFNPELDKTQGDVAATVASGNSVEGGLVKGDKITLTPKANIENGYMFVRFETSEAKGLKVLDADNYIYEVIGNVDPEVKAVFAKGTVKATYKTTTSYGTLTVTDPDNNEKVIGETVVAGSKLHIVAKAEEGYVVDKVSLNGAAIDSEKDEDKTAERFDVTITAPNADFTIEASFKKADGKSLTITADPAGSTTKWSVVVDGVEATKDNSFTGGVRYTNISPDAKLSISFTLNTTYKDYSIEALWDGKPVTCEKLEDGSYVIKDQNMGSSDVNLVIKATKLLAVSITDYDEELVYNGEKQAVDFTLNQTGLDKSKITVKYSTAEDGEFREGPLYSEVSDASYWVEFSYEGDDKYEAFSEKKEYKITPAEIVITEVPKVSVVQNEKKQYIYKLEGGKACYYKNNGKTAVEVTDGKFVTVIKSGSSYTVTENVPNGSEKEGTVYVRYAIDNKNFTQPKAATVIYGGDAISVQAKVKDAKYGTLVIKNGGAIVTSSADTKGVEVAEGTKITFDIQKADEAIKDEAYHVYLVDGTGVHQDKDKDYYKTGYTVGDGTLNPLIFMLEVNDARKTLVSVNEPEKTLVWERTYKEKTSQGVTPEEIEALFPLTDTDNKQLSYNNGQYKGRWNITYVNKEGKTVAEPEDAGVYKVTLVREATGEYNEFTVTGELTINQAELTEDQVSRTPTASQIALGMTLENSTVTGKVTVAGHYDWDSNLVNKRTERVKEAGKEYPVVFYPDNKNYANLELTAKVEVPVTELPVVIMRTPDFMGTIEVKDKLNGRIYTTGEEVAINRELIITAKPNTDCELKTLTVNGSNFTNGGTYKFTNVSVIVEATFKPKSTTVIVPEGQYEIDLPDAVRGAMISYVGDPIVDRGDDFSFTVTTLAADADKLKVTANGLTLKRAANGSYTISDVTEKQTVRISFSSTPTEVKVDIPLVYHEEGHATQGEVSIINNTSGDGKYFYGDELTLIAFPESGVTFEGWSDKSKQQVRELTLTGNVSLRALFSGSPTGIEDIEAARIVAGDGYILVKNVASANVTVVSMAGRIQTQQRISGDAQIRVPAGIYVVLLESGQDVKRTKVIVR